MDDLLEILSQRDCSLAKIFTKVSHHSDISVVFTSQILYSGASGNHLKTLVSNATGLFVWRNFREAR